MSHYLSPLQHGFHHGPSTATNVMQLLLYYYSPLYKGIQVDAISTDLHSAFNLDRIGDRIKIGDSISLQYSIVASVP